MIKIEHTDAGLALMAKGPAVQLASEVAAAVALVADKIGEECDGFDCEDALDLITGTARELLDELRSCSDGMAQ